MFDVLRSSTDRGLVEVGASGTLVLEPEPRLGDDGPVFVGDGLLDKSGLLAELQDPRGFNGSK